MERVNLYVHTDKITLLVNHWLKSILLLFLFHFRLIFAKPLGSFLGRPDQTAIRFE